MLIETKQQNVDLWEAWIDMQTATDGNIATLYLIGDVFTDDRFSAPYFIKKEHTDPHVLSLQIYPGITSEDGYVTEVMYAEELQDIDQYSSILIYTGSELLASIEDIETVF